MEMIPEPDPDDEGTKISVRARHVIPGYGPVLLKWRDAVTQVGSASFRANTTATDFPE